MENNLLNKQIYIFKQFLVDYGFYKEVYDLYLLNRIDTILQINSYAYLKTILWNTEMFKKYFGLANHYWRKWYDKIVELNDLWLLEIIYNKDKRLFSYNERYQAIKLYNQIHRFETECIEGIKNGKKYYTITPKTISIKVLEEIYNKNE